MYFKINQQTDAQCDFLITEPKDSIVLVPNFITANSREFFEPNFFLPPEWYISACHKRDTLALGRRKLIRIILKGSALTAR